MATPPPPAGFEFEMFARDRDGNGATLGTLGGIQDIHAAATRDADYNPNWNISWFDAVVTGQWNEGRVAEWSAKLQAFVITDTTSFRPEKIFTGDTEVWIPYGYDLYSYAQYLSDDIPTWSQFDRYAHGFASLITGEVYDGFYNFNLHARIPVAGYNSGVMSEIAFDNPFQFNYKWTGTSGEDNWNFYLGSGVPNFYGNLTAYAGEGNDIITGNDRADRIFGEGGDDTIRSHHGAESTAVHNDLDLPEGDYLDGGSGNDVVYGEFNSTLIGGAGMDVVVLDLHDQSAGMNFRMTAQLGQLTQVGPGTFISGFELFSFRLGYGSDTIDLSGYSPADADVQGYRTSMVLGGGGFDTLIADMRTSLKISPVEFEKVVLKLGDATADISIGSASTWGFWTVYTLNGLIDINPDTTQILQVSTGAGNDVIYGLFGDDVIETGAGNDTITGNRGNDLINGQGGFDTAGFSGNRSDYTISYSADGLQITVSDTRSGGPDGIDTLVGIERLTFADQTVGGISNDAPTNLTISSLSVSEGTKVGDRIGTLSASDAENDAIAYALLADASGSVNVVGNGVFLSKELDFETISSLRFTIEAADSVGGKVFRDFTLAVSDVRETVTGTASADVLKGGIGSDLLVGKGGNDTIDGKAGNDVVHGGAGADRLTGGSGSDVFLYKGISEIGNKASTRDTILDFSREDRIDLSAIDANPKTAGNQAFTYIGASAFHGKAGELRFEKQKSDTIIYADVDGDAKTDFAIHLDDPISLQKSFFVL